MDYPTVKAPFELNFRDMTRARAHEFLAWFIEEIPSRISVLTQYVARTPAYHSWKADLSPASLDLLGEWFCHKAEVRAASGKEIGAMGLPVWLQQVASGESLLTSLTMNLAVDIGMYFGQTIIANNPVAHWDLVTRPKSSADYQQPALFGRTRMSVNPVRLMSVYAYGIADKSQGPKRLGELYFIWSSTLNE